MRSKVWLQKEDYAKALSSYDSLQLFLIMKKVTEQATAANADELLKQYILLQWVPGKQTLNDFILEVEDYQERLEIAGHQMGDNDKAERLAATLKLSKVDAVDRVIHDTQVMNKNDPNFPKYEVLKNMLVILERKNPYLSQTPSFAVASAIVQKIPMMRW